MAHIVAGRREGRVPKDLYIHKEIKPGFRAHPQIHTKYICIATHFPVSEARRCESILPIFEPMLQIGNSDTTKLHLWV